MKLKFLKATLTSLTIALLSFISTANAGLITNGFTFSVASDCDQSSGNHFHSSTGGDFGNPSGKAEIGNFSCEEVRGLSEYDLGGLVTTPEAFVTFDAFSYGLFSGTNDFPFNGMIDIVLYQGNNAEDISDYQAIASTIVGSFSTNGINIGDIFSFDISAAFNNAITNNWSSLGIRLQTEGTGVSDGGAWVFDDFRLTTTDDTTTSVPEPSSLAIFALGMMGLASRRFKQ
ncbi:hypothetical protein NBRC116592_03050 [Colwellia sp. KU-HH00111]|uniref:PEP-CTERM sorting domain-containing protein n=1 Tax=Colwellia sp. KU-HH00111 TaxID=3127652 RepID=UPI00310330A6